jgi:CRP-like cAMP-binding protein
MASKTTIEMLGSVGLFEGLSRRELGMIHKQAREMDYPEGKTIVKEGDAGVSFHLILEGKAKVVARGRTEATLRPGQYFGELSLIDRGPRTASVIATTNVRTLVLVSWEFMAMLDESPKITRKLLLEFCSRLREERTVHTH